VAGPLVRSSLRHLRRAIQVVPTVVSAIPDNRRPEHSGECTEYRFDGRRSSADIAESRASGHALLPVLGTIAFTVPVSPVE
jgi:hypothetical protein